MWHQILHSRFFFCLADIIVDVICDEEPFLNGFAHRGILRGATRIMKEGGEALKEALETHPGYRLVITGHSLGAGTAVLITMGLLKGHYNNIKTNNIQCIALAAPPVFRSESEIPDMKNHIKNFVNRNDIVPRLSLANMAKIVAMARAIDEIELNALDYAKIIAGIDDPEVNSNLEKLSNIVSKVKQDQFPYLEHPGNVYYFQQSKSDPQKFQVSNPTGKYFSESLLFFDNMVLDHLQPYYEAAFANVEFEEDGENT